MNQVGKINFKKIQRVSPSQFYSMKNCAYKSLLAEAMNKKPLLPISANAYYGTVLHKMLELISKGVIQSEDDFNKVFQEEIKLVEEKLVEDGHDFFVPLQKNVKNFTEKKILLKDHLSNSSRKQTRKSNTKFYTEKWFESKDTLIGGKIDLIIETEHEIEILDFKTGAITQNVLDDEGEVYAEIKVEYKDQLKLYAFLYFDDTGKFPTELSLIDLAKEKFSISFSQNECKAIFEEAKILLSSINNSIDTSLFKANPNEKNCKYCLYRPACSFYLKQIETITEFNDVSGLLVNVIKFQNGNVSIHLESGENRITVSNLSNETFDDLLNSKKKKINVFNLKKETRTGFYTATKTTMIYE